MCTVTFIARRNGYALGMNRDEKLSRVPGLPPARHCLNGRTAIFPSEPSGGTWVGVNDAQVTLALVNWYSVPSRASHDPISRGEVTRTALGLADAQAIEQHLGQFPLERTNPFRLIGVFPQTKSVVEWRWNLSQLERLDHDWQTNIWISSGYDEWGAEIARRRIFVAAGKKGVAKDLRWLRRLHGSHDPAPNAYSICMHRADARTVSYTEITVTGSATRLAHAPLALCCGSSHWSEQRVGEDGPHTPRILTI